MMELPRGYKVEGKSLNLDNKKNKEWKEITVSLKVPSKYDILTLEDVDYINQECIKTEDCLYLNKSIDGRVYVVAFDVVKKKINEKKFIEEIPKRFQKAMRKFKEMNS